MSQLGLFKGCPAGKKYKESRNWSVLAQKKKRGQNAQDENKKRSKKTLPRDS